MVVWARGSIGEVEDVDHREQGGVQGVEHKMSLVPAAIFYLKPRYTRRWDTIRATSLKVLKSTKGHKARWHHDRPTQQESSMISGSSSPPASNTSPLQALNLTDPWAPSWSSADLQTEKFRQWMMMCCAASELSRCRKFIWTRPTLIAGCSNG